MKKKGLLVVFFFGGIMVTSGFGLQSMMSPPPVPLDEILELQFQINELESQKKTLLKEVQTEFLLTKILELEKQITELSNKKS